MALFGAMALPALAEVQLELGYYVDPAIPCASASNVDVSLVHWSGINASRIVCDFTSVSEIGEDLYSFVQSCTEIGTEGAIELTGEILISSAKAFELRTEAGTFPYRYCAQDEMPEPWRSNDLSDYRR